MADQQELDFVCNEYVLNERLNGWTWGRYGGVNLFSGLTSLFCLILTIIWVVMETARAEHLARIGQYGPIGLGIPLFLLAIALIGLVVSMIMLREFPTNMKMNEFGFWLAWHYKNARRSPQIPWTSIIKVSARKVGTPKPNDPTSNIVVSFVIDKKTLPWFLIASLITDTAALWKNTYFLPLFSRNITLEFPLDSLTLDADRYRMMSAIRSRVPPSAVSDDFKAVCDSGNVPTFTQLWLDDMQSFRRTRADELPAGALLQEGRYEVRTKIATGGQAKIYGAFDTHMRCMVAIKELVLPINAGADVRNRSFANVKNEAMLLSKLEHPGIVKLLDNFVEDHRAYLVLEHIQGTSLRALIKDRGPLAPEVVSSYARQICDFLSYIHSLSPPVIHRDLTPDNLMVTEDGTVRLLDFNVAQQLESASTKTVVGKHNYMAPEQFKGKPTTQSDLYSLGCTLFYLLTGQDPVPLSCSHPKERSENVLVDMDDLVAKLTNLELSKRYANAKEVSEDLEKLVDHRMASDSARCDQIEPAKESSSQIDDAGAGEKLDLSTRIKVSEREGLQ